MFGFGKSKPVQLTPFSQFPNKRFGDFICDGVIAEHLSDFAALREVHRQLQAKHPGERVLATLDNPGQAVYTSGHAINKHMLDDIEGHDLSALGPECFEDGEHCGYLTTLAEFPIRLANLRARAAQTTFSDASGVLFWENSDDEGPTSPDAVMRDPDDALRMGHLPEVHFQFVPVTAAADALVALPNGYFTSDLTPMQSYAVAQHLEHSHALALFGVGASYLGFSRHSELTPNEAAALALDIVTLYDHAPGDAVQRLANALVGKDWLLLRYTES